MSCEVVLKVENVGKRYEIYEAPHHRLLQTLLRGKKQFYKEFWALKDVSFEVKKGECLGIIGSNGCGKSTLLQIIAGTLAPTTGKVSVKGRIAALLELGSGFNPEFTGRENVYMNGAIMGLSKAEMDQKFDKIASFADIGEFIDQPVKIYSSGMMVRLAFAVASHIDPDLLIVDEALSVGDMAFQSKCYRKFDEFREKGVTILLVTHDLSSVLKYCDRSLVLEKGEALAEGAPRRMVDVYKQRIMPNIDQLKNDGENAPPRDCQTLLKTHFKDHKAVLDYGDRLAEIVDWGLLDEHGRSTEILTDKNDRCEIVIRVKVHQPLPELILAFSIKDIKGNEVTGTNTLFEGKKFDAPKIGEILEARFSQPLALQNGVYTLNLGCTHIETKGVIVHHRLYDVLIFEVHSADRFVGVFNPASTIQIRQMP